MAAPTNMVTQPFVNPVTGGVYLDNGNLTTDGLGNITANGVAGGVSALATIATSGTISTSSRVIRTTVAGAVTSCVLATGTVQGQEVTIVNENTTGSNKITFAASGTSNVAAGAIDISGLTSARFVWDQSLWYRTV